MTVEELIEVLQKQDQRAIVVTSDAEFVTEIMDVGCGQIIDDKLVFIGPGVCARQWIGSIADHTGKLYQKATKRPVFKPLRRQFNEKTQNQFCS